MIIEQTGNLFDFKHEAYAQGINPKGVMSDGIAKQFSQHYPELFKRYKRDCKQDLITPGSVYIWTEEGKPRVFNLVTQYSLARADKKLLDKTIRTMYQHSKSLQVSDIAMPYIGCGKGGLPKEYLLEALKPFIEDARVKVTLYSLEDAFFSINNQFCHRHRN